MLSKTAMTTEMEGQRTYMNAAAMRAAHRPMYRGAIFSALIAGAVALALPSAVLAQAAPMAKSGSTPMAAPMMASAPPAMATQLPTSVLLFPAVVSTDSGDGGTAAAAALAPNQKLAEQIVTESLRTIFDRAKVGVVVYNRKLPSIQRAVQEGVKPEDAAAGPGDDPRKAQKFANILGANEYVTASIDSYKYEQASRTVTFNLNLFRYAADGTVLGTTAVKAVGSAPSDIQGTHQESFADEAASQVAAEQAIDAVYPQVAAVLNPPKKEMQKKHGHHKLGGLFLVPVIAIGAAIIGPRS